MKTAIVGTGISGMVCGHLLADHHELTVFESSGYVGGHTNTINLDMGTKNYAIDTGFIVFNKKTYPRFLSLMDGLGVKYQETSMSFSVKCEVTGLEYNGTNINSLFAQRLNLFRPGFLRMIKGILSFNKAAKAFLSEQRNETTLGQFIREAKVPDAVVKYYLIPMAASVWSADPRQMWDFPANFLLRFWANHGFLEIDTRPQWYVISGGSSAYIPSLTEKYRHAIQLNTPVKSVRRNGCKVFVKAGSRPEEEFDHVIFACHSDQALKIIQDPSEKEQRLLASIPYIRNRAILHTDPSVLPKKKLAWAAWNYHLAMKDAPTASLTYNMNILQSIPEDHIFNVTLNPRIPIAPELILRTIDYHHPVFTIEGIDQQNAYEKFSGQNNTSFCGAYLGNGFHEDGVVSAIKVCKNLGVAA